MNDDIILSKPPTKIMVEVLMDCHERELLKTEPMEAFTVPSLAGLVKRGMVNSRSYITQSGKRIIAIFITYSGRQYLNRLK
jgi:hypothetical protein